MSDIKPASEVREELEKSIEEKVEGVKGSINSAIESAKSSDSWPAEYDISSYDLDTQSRIDSEVSGQGYTTSVKDGKLYIEKP